MGEAASWHGTTRSPARNLSVVGRDRELGELVAALEAARSGLGSLVQLVGEPGIGKTTLVRAFGDIATDQGATVVWGRCWEGGGAPAYWPWVQVVRAVLELLDDQAVAPTLAPARLLAQILPELRTVGEASVAQPPEPPEHARFALFDAVSRLLRASAAGPLVVIVEDLHAADAPSVLLLRFLARELHAAQVMLVATFRDVGAAAAPATAQALTELGDEGRRVVVRALRPEEVGCLVEASTGTVPSAGAVARLHRASGGNPFFLDQLVREEVAGSSPLPGHAALLPETCRRAIHRRIGLLSPGCASLLAQAAVLGPTASLTALLAVSGFGVEEVLDFVDEATRAGLLVETERGSCYSFVHALVREALYSELVPSMRLRLHRRVGDALEALYAPDHEPHLAELAHHFAAAAPVGQIDKAIHFSMRAGEQALGQLAYEEAASQFARALALIEAFGSANPERRCQVLLALGDAQSRAGERTAARASFEQAVRLARSLGSPECLARAALGLTVGENMSSSDPTLVALLEEALASLGTEHSALQVLVLSRLAIALSPIPGSAERAGAVGDEAVAVGRRLDDPATLARALTARLHARWDRATPEDLLATASEMLALAEPSGAIDMILQAYMWRLIALLSIGDIPGCSAALAAYETIARRAGQPLWLFYAASRHAAVALLAGRFEDAERLMDEAGTAAARSEEEDDALRVLTCQRMHLDWLRGRRHRLEEALPTIRAWAQSFSLSSIVTPAALLGWLLWATGHEAQARAEVERLATYPEAELPTWTLDVVVAMSVVTDVLVEIPHCAVPDAAIARMYESLRPRAGQMVVAAGAVLCFGLVDRSLGQLAGMLGRVADASAHLEDAVEGHRRLGAWPWLARTQRDYARVLLLAGSPEANTRATALIAEAKAIAAELGMASLLAELEALVPLCPTVSAPKGDAVAEFRREGEYWTLRYGGNLTRLRHAVGLAYLHQLLTHPGREFHVLDLVGLAQGEARRRAPSSGAGEVLDANARAAYRRRLEELAEELAEAESFGDRERATRARAESDVLVDQLTAAFGLGGRARMATSDAERARSAVTKAIRSALGRIAAADPILGRHLRATVRTGLFCSYGPEAPVSFG